MIVYDKLFSTMREKCISQKNLKKSYGITTAQLTRLRRNENVNTHTLNRLCEILECGLEDIAEYKKNVEN